MRWWGSLALAAVVAVLAAPAAGAASGSTQFESLAARGIANAQRYWFDPSRGWYLDTIADPDSMPLARLWSAYPLFEALDAQAIADPTAANKAAVRTFVAGAERYWNPQIGGYVYYPTLRGADKMTFFDDTGWWGLGFMDAWRATHDHRDVVDAARAFRFIVGPGWNKDGGGTWWDSRHHKITSEPLAAGILLGVELYEATRQPGYLKTAKRLLAWADARSWNAKRQLYQRNPTDATVMDYVEGMMAAAHAELCKATGARSYCAKAEALGRASQAAFPEPLNWGPQYDAIYLRWMLDVGTITHDRTWYDLAARTANRAAANAADGRGLYVRGWDGAPASAHGGEPDMLEFHAATTSLFAWLAATPVP